MRVKSWVLPFCLLTILCVAQTPREGPMPLPPSRKPDFWELDRPGSQQQRHMDMRQVKQQADELAKLASIVPGDVSHLQAGLMPKDLKNNLKRIEKLSKQLRQELGE
jgi:hypothetical protein